MEIPKAAKYATVAALTAVWKWAYYAPNTYKELQISKWKQVGKELPKDLIPEKPVALKGMISPDSASERAVLELVKPVDFLAKVVGPFLLTRFLLLPAPLLAVPGVGPSLFFHAVINLALADMLTNIHGFVTIVTNHCGDDIYTFDDEVKPKTSSFYVRQIVGSANYAAGNDPIDFAHGFLNYQIEHHVSAKFARSKKISIDLL